MTRNYDVQDTASWCVFVPPPPSPPPVREGKGVGGLQRAEEQIYSAKKMAKRAKKSGLRWVVFIQPATFLVLPKNMQLEKCV